MGSASLEADVLIYQMLAECNKFKCNRDRPGLDSCVILRKRSLPFVEENKKY